MISGIKAFGIFCVVPIAVRRYRDCYRQLLTECGRNVEEGMKQLEDESEEDPNVSDCSLFTLKLCEIQLRICNLFYPNNFD